MRLDAVLRYPVKSLQGERVRDVEVDGRGLAYDRRWAVVDHDGKLGSGKSSQRFRRMDGLLRLSAALVDGEPLVTLPDGSAWRAGDPALDAALSAYVGREVALREEGEVPHFDDGPVHLVTTASLVRVAEELGHDVPVARFRPNLVLSGVNGPFAEDGWLGRELQVGGVRLRVAERMPRCVMTTLEQAGLPADREVLAGVTRLNEGTFGVWCTVVRPGRLAVGDRVVVDAVAGYA